MGQRTPSKVNSEQHCRANIHAAAHTSRSNCDSDDTLPAIQDYGAIGDSRAVALVSKYGGIDWLCWPQVDSPPIFAALLDRERGGAWVIAPTAPCQVSRQYIQDTNILKTSFTCRTGSADLLDLMPVASEQYKHREMVPDHELVRQVECRSGEVELRFELYPRLDYGRKAVCLRAVGRLGIRFESDGMVCWLRSTHPLTVNSGRATGLLRLRAGEVAQFSLTYGKEAPMVLPPLGDPIRTRIEQSVAWWQQWARRAEYQGPYRAEVVRSALALKLLTYSPSGAVLAAATTSLPERLGSELNWDYRYCWLRDASMTVRALLGLGYQEETEAFLNWILHATALTRPQLRIVYDVFGRNAPRERTLENLRGYRDSRPVRIGNAAREQVQLDVYGEVVDAAAQYAFHGRTFDRATQKVLLGIGNYVAAHWSEPDEGIWEPRSGRAHHTHSRLLCWTALDRLLRLGKQGRLQGVPVDRYHQERDKIYTNIKDHCWQEPLRSYTATLDGNDLDASLLLMSWYGFEAADSERMLSTRRAIRQQLGTRNGLLRRYLRNPPEGAFGICGFWDVEYLALGGGTLDEAQQLFQQQLSFQNDIGLFAEEIDPESGDALGNFPQAFTHVGLISAALSLQERDVGAKPLAHRAPSAEQAHAEVTR